MKISRIQLELVAEDTGFRIEIIEKVIKLMEVLQALSNNPFLKDKIALKGGTALNLFYLKYPRLSVDIDLNYIGSPDKEIMTKDRMTIHATLEKLFQQLELQVQKKSIEHAGEKWILRYASVIHGMGNLMIDFNFLLRVPLWPIIHLNSFHLGPYQVNGIPLLDKHEIAGGKLRALFSRHSSRDLFDVHQILFDKQFNVEKMRLAFIVYGAMSRHDWREVNQYDIQFEWKELRNMLIPMLRKAPINRPREWSEKLMTECRDRLSLLLPFTKNEANFLNFFLEEGEITPSLICEDKDLINRIAQQPGLLWKSIHIQQKKN